MKSPLLIVFLFLVIFSCSKKEPIGKHEYVELSYQQTQCSDPWRNGSSDSATLQNLAKYLADQQLYVASMNIKVTSTGFFCEACICKTGKTIYVSTLNSSGLIDGYRKLGFEVVR